MNRYIVDRIEGDMVLCETEDKKIVRISRKTLPLNIKEGDVIVESNNTFTINETETLNRKLLVKRKLDSLLE